MRMVKMGVAIASNGPMGKTIAVVGDVPVESVKELIGTMVTARKQWEDEGKPNSGETDE